MGTERVKTPRWEDPELGNREELKIHTALAIFSSLNSVTLYGPSIVH
jgi:hypothetical protein